VNFGRRCTTGRIFMMCCGRSTPPHP